MVAYVNNAPRLQDLDVDTYALLYNNSLNKNSVLNDLASSQSLSASDAINALIKDKAIEQEAQNEGIQVTDAEAKEQLNNMGIVNSEFDKNWYS